MRYQQRRSFVTVLPRQDRATLIESRHHVVAAAAAVLYRANLAAAAAELITGITSKSTRSDQAAIHSSSSVRSSHSIT